MPWRARRCESSVARTSLGADRTASCPLSGRRRRFPSEGQSALGLHFGRGQGAGLRVAGDGELERGKSGRLRRFESMKSPVLYELGDLVSSLRGDAFREMSQGAGC